MQFSEEMKTFLKSHASDTGFKYALCYKCFFRGYLKEIELSACILLTNALRTKIKLSDILKIKNNYRDF